MLRKILIIIRYIKFRLQAKNAHGIHSPFVFDLYTKVICGFTRQGDRKTLTDIRKKMMVDRRILNVADFGTAERNPVHRKLSVSYIAKNYASGKKKTELLCRLSKYFAPSTILELGTSIGIGTTALALGAPQAKIISLEGSSEIAEVARENFVSAGVSNVEVITREFNETLSAASGKLSLVDLVFIDGNHRSAPTLSYFEICLARANENSLFIFDDLHWSADMETAWKEIQKHSSVTITIDLFFVGLVFFRKGIAKQHFILQF